MGIGPCTLHFLADLFVHLEKLCDTAIYADALPLVEFALGIPWTDALAMTRPIRGVELECALSFD